MTGQFVMDIHDIRQGRMAELLKIRFAGKKVKFAEAIDRAPDYISRCLATNKYRKKIGEEFARYVEKKLNLDPMWMDRLVSQTGVSEPSAVYEGATRPLTAKEQIIMDLVMGLTPEQQDEVLPALRAAFDANRITQRQLKKEIKTVGNHRIENEFGRPGEKKLKGKHS